MILIIIARSLGVISIGVNRNWRFLKSAVRNREFNCRMFRCGPDYVEFRCGPDYVEEALQLEGEAADIAQRARQKSLTTEERKAELLARRARIEGHLEHVANANKAEREVDAVSARTDAAARKELAEVNAALADLEATGTKGKGRGGIPQTDALAHQGIFLGSRRDPLIDVTREQLRALKQISGYRN
jgi:hypothetical protein